VSTPIWFITGCIIRSASIHNPNSRLLDGNTS
jgi:hypothetical protein